MKKLIVGVVSLAACGALAACGGTTEEPPTRPKAAPRGGLSPTPQEAGRRFAAEWSNWTSETILTQNERLATMAVGRARREAIAGARDPKTMRASIRYDLANRGRVESVHVKEPRGAKRKLLIVVRQSYAKDGRFDRKFDDDFRVISAEVKQTPKGWGVSAWKPVL